MKQVAVIVVFWGCFFVLSASSTLAGVVALVAVITVMVGMVAERRIPASREARAKELAASLAEPRTALEMAQDEYAEADTEEERQAAEAKIALALERGD